MENKENDHFCEKWRPQKIEDILTDDKIKNTLTTLIKNKTFPNLIFHGPAGIGKTSTMLAFMREMFGDDYKNYILELNSSLFGGIDTIRNQVTQFAQMKPISNILNNNNNYFKIIIFDEADSLTSESQAMLRGLIEEYSLHIRFCLICNYIQKINTAIKSRCIIMNFKILNKTLAKKKIIEIINYENIKMTDAAIDNIIKYSRGDMRKIINCLYTLHIINTNKIIDIDDINENFGIPNQIDILTIYQLLINDSINIKKCVKQINEIILKKNYSLIDIMNEIYDIIINEELDENNKNIIVILKKMELNLYKSNNYLIQLGGLVGLFKIKNKKLINVSNEKY